MRASMAGLLWALIFVVMESVQFVYFGGLFQRINTFTFGALVLGISSATFILWGLLQRRNQVRTALAQSKLLWQINLTATFAWIAFLGSVQLIEPAVAYTIGSGVMPLTAYLAYRFGMSEGDAMRNRLEGWGNATILVAILFLAIITVLGLSGFAQSDVFKTALGVGFAIADGVFFTFLLIYCQRLDRKGVGAGVVFGFRFPLYVLVAAVLSGVGLEAKSTVPPSEMVVIVVIGIALVVPPLYALQRAVASVSTMTLAAITATGPFVIFVLQIFEGRVAQSGATLIGLGVYFVGANLAAVGAIKAQTQKSA